MNILDSAPQGSPAWHAARASRFCASEAAAAMGVSKYTTRSDLLKQKSTGIVEDASPAKQRLFDAGHAAEKAAMPIAQEIAGVEFYPAVGVADIEGLPLLASFDGIDMLEAVLWENKMRNAALVGQVCDRDLEAHYWAQLEHQLLVSGAQKVLFTTSDGTQEGTDHLWYESIPERRAQVIAAWKQFAIDLAAYVPVEAKVEAVGRTPETLPALRIEVTGAVTASNLVAFKEHALAVFGGINRELTTDQDFADAEKTVKWCGDVEDRLAAAKQHALSQTESIDALFRAIDEISAEARKTRLDLDRLVKARKDQVRLEIVREGTTALVKHVDSLNARLGKTYMPEQFGDFAGAIKGKRTVESMRDAVDSTLAKAKIAASAIADRIQANMALIGEQAAEHAFLFPDEQVIVQKLPEDLDRLVKARIAEHATAEQHKRDAEALAAAALQTAAAPAPAASVEAPVDTPAPTAAPAVYQLPTRAAAPAADSGAATLLIGGINLRLGYDVNAAFLKRLGFEPARIDGARRFYRDSDLPLIGRAIAEHTLRVTQTQAAAA